MKPHKHKKQLFLVQNLPFFVVAVVAIIGLAVSLGPKFTGQTIYEQGISLSTIALEEGADADVVIAAANFARKFSITETMLTSEMSGAEEHTLIVKNIGGDTATITQSGTNLLLEGNADSGFAALNNLESTNYEIFSQYDAVEVVDGQVKAVASVAEEEAQPLPQNNCVDSDGGDNPNVYGELSGTDAYGNVISQTDQCGSGTATMNDVFEKVCTDTSYTYTQHTCENGCANGVCIEGAVCGNAVVESGESCDDGNTVDGDGCTSACALEVNKECYETDTGVSGTYSGYYYDYYEGQKQYSTDYNYNNYCYYYDYYNAYYYADYYCYQSTDTKWYPTSTWTQCTSGCEDDKGCVDVQTVISSCEDSDGVDDKTFGTTTSTNKFGEQKVIEDTCYSYNDDYHYVIEGYCSETTAYTQYLLCDGICKEGVCVEAQAATCEDTDATDIYSPQESSFVLGEVQGTDRSGNTYSKSDYCYDSYGYKYVVEQYCNDNNIPVTTWVYCPGGCDNGVCVKPDWTQSCTDNDATQDNAGRDLYTASSVSGTDYYGNKYTYADYCYYNNWDNTNYVVDYYCIESNSYGPYASAYYEQCPSGCTAGACDAANAISAATCVATENSVAGNDQYGNQYAYTNACMNMATLLKYSCETGADGAPFVATEVSCNCVEGICVDASMTISEFFTAGKNAVIVIGAAAATEDNIAAIDLAGAYGWDVVTDATITDYAAQNIIAIGGPYANAASKQALGGEVWDYQPGQALFFLREYDAAATVVVSGSEAIDTRNAVKKLIDNPEAFAYDYGVEQVS